MKKILKVTLLPLVMVSFLASCSEGKKPGPSPYTTLYLILPYFEHCKSDDIPYLMVEGTSITFTLEAETGYRLSDNPITLVDPTSVTCTFDKATSQVTFSNPRKNIQFYAKAEKEFDVTVNVTNGMHNAPSKIVEGESISFKITPYKDYKLPDEIAYTGCDCSYDKTTGDVTLSNATNNVTITANCYKEVYPLTINHDSVDFDPAPEAQISVSRPQTYNVSIPTAKQDTYILPTEEEVESSAVGCTCDFTRTNDHAGVLTLSNPTADVTININAFKNKLTVIEVDEVNIDITDAEGGELLGTNFKPNEPFTFKISTEGTAYTIPSTLEIYVGKSETPLGEGTYDIVPEPKGSTTNALVTVHADKVTDDLKIKGEGVAPTAYNYSISGMYGVTTTTPTTGSHKFDEDFEIEFTTETKKINESYEIPAVENILISINGGEPFNPDKTHADQCAYAKVDNSKIKLTIKANEVTSNLEIRLRAHDYDLLNKLSWDKISEIALAGRAAQTFYLGEEKEVEVNKQIHHVRIVGFDHDDLNITGLKAGMTFEFVEVLSDESGNAINYEYNLASTNTNYVGSLINSYYLKNIVLPMLPPELRNQLRTVVKKSRVPTDATYSNWTDYPLATQLFLISYSEATSDYIAPVPDEGATYAYYPLFKPYEKKDINSKSTSYWSRTAYEPLSSSFYFCSSVGYGSTQYVNQAMPIAPMFCI